MSRSSAKKLRPIRVLAWSAALSVTILIGASGSGDAADSQKRSSKPKVRIDYSEFSHPTHVVTQKLACDSCHKFPTKNWKEVRIGDAAFPDVADFPEHSACLGCHRPQFFARERPAPKICSNCHVAVTPRDTTRFLFPSLGDVADASRPARDFVSEFVVSFPHETHLEVVSRRSTEPGAQLVTVSWAHQKKTPATNCHVCHQTHQPQDKSSEEYVTKPSPDLGDAFWLKKGTFQTIPASHAVCFTCHNADSGIAPASSDCQVCHRLASSEPVSTPDFDSQLAEKMGITDRWSLNAGRKRISAGAFRHEGGAHPDLTCTSCHNPARMNTADAKTLKVPVASCGGADGCHVTATADDGGILNYEIDQRKTNPGFVCNKCHIAFGKAGVPASHVEAIPKK